MPRKTYTARSAYNLMMNHKIADALVDLCENNNIAIDFETGKGMEVAFWKYGEDKNGTRIITDFAKPGELNFGTMLTNGKGLNVIHNIVKAAENNELLVYKDDEFYPRPVKWNAQTKKMELGKPITKIGKEPSKPNFLKGLLHSMNKKWFKDDFARYDAAMEKFHAGNESLEANAEAREQIVGQKAAMKMAMPKVSSHIAKGMAEASTLESQYAENRSKGKKSPLMESMIREANDNYVKASSYMQDIIKTGHVNSKELSDSLYNIAGATLLREFYQANDGTIEKMEQMGVTKDTFINALRDMPELKAFDNMTEWKYVKLCENPEFMQFGEKIKNKIKATVLNEELPQDKETLAKQAAKEQAEAEAAKKQAAEQAGKKLAGDAIKFQNFKKAYWWDTNADARKELPTRLDKMVQQADHVYKRVMDYTGSIQKGVEVKPKAQDLSASLYNLAAVTLLRDFYLEGDSSVEKMMETGLGSGGFVSALRKVPELKETFDNMTEEKYVKLINSPNFMKFDDKVKDMVKIAAKGMRMDLIQQGKTAPTREQMQMASAKKAKTAQQNQVKQPDPLQKG